MTDAIRDKNHVPVALGVSSSDNTVTLPLLIDPVTGALKVVFAASTLDLVNATTDNSISVDQNGNVGTNVATDGAIHIENTGNTGIGLGVYSNIGATASAPLVSIKADNTAFDQDVVSIVNDGAGTGLYIEQNGVLGSSQRAFEIQLNSIMDDGTKFGFYLYTNQIHTSSTAALFKIVNDNASATNRCFQLQQDASNIALYLDMNGNERAVLIDHDDTGTQYSLVIDRDGNNAAQIWAMQINCDNAGAGTPGGIDFGGFSTGEEVFKFVADATDPTGGGGAATGRIAVEVGGATVYLPYY